MGAMKPPKPSLENPDSIPYPMNLPEPTQHPPEVIAQMKADTLKHWPAVEKLPSSFLDELDSLVTLHGSESASQKQAQVPEDERGGNWKRLDLLRHTARRVSTEDLRKHFGISESK
jgi:hypothetical protein